VDGKRILAAEQVHGGGHNAPKGIDEIGEVPVGRNME
jgi:hypothetical protein